MKSQNHNENGQINSNLQIENANLSEQIKHLFKTERDLYKYQQQLDKQIQLYRELHNIGNCFNKSHDVDEILHLAIDFIINKFNFERCLILKRSSEVFHISAWDGYYDDASSQNIESLSLMADMPVLAPLSFDSEHIICTKTCDDKQLLALRSRFGMDEYIISAIKRESQQIIYLVIAGNMATRASYYTRVHDKDEFIMDLANFLNQTSIAVNNAELLENLRAMDELKNEFLANTSHELRTPLNGIIGIAESLMDGAAGKLPQSVLSDLMMIAVSGRRLAHLVNDILDFSRLKRQDIALQLKPVSLREIIEIVLVISDPLKGKKKLQLINTLAPDLPPALADENRVQQILYNLIGNGIKFTESGRIEISARKQKKEEQEELVITVSDTGIGIPKEKLVRIFDAFEQADSSTARNYGGSGLGLAVTKQLVELHHGKIWVESKEGAGSRFIFTLPVAEGATESLLHQSSLLTRLSSADMLERPMVTISPQASGTPQGEFKILIVDDELVNLRVLANHLSLNNYEVIQATSGLQALALLEEGLKPDLILLDVMMPKMSGYEVMRKIRETWEINELPILLVTAKNQISDLVAGLEAGANDYLTKPISKGELLARVKTHINIKKIKEENIRMKAELDVARRLQQMLLPLESELNQITGLEIAGFMEPAKEIGGDYYDVIQHHGRVLFGIGDVTGHGLESGMLMLMTQAAVRTLLENEKAGKTELVSFLNSINGMIYKNVRERMKAGNKNLTLSLLEYQPGAQGKTGNILRVSGRHEEIIVVRNGNLERIDTSKLGFWIGFLDNISKHVMQTEVVLNSGDVVVLYTDGIIEAANLENEEYGIERLCGVVKQHWQKPVKEIRQIISDDVRQHIGQQKVFDDMTLLLLKQK